MAREPIASTRACSTASKMARACLPSGASLAVDAVVVAGAPQGHGIAQAAGHRDVVSGRLLRQFGQSHPVSGKSRPVLREGDFQLVVAGDGAHADRHSTAKGFTLAVGPRLVARGVVARTRHLILHHQPSSPFSGGEVPTGDKGDLTMKPASPGPRWRPIPAILRRKRADRTRRLRPARVRRTC